MSDLQLRARSVSELVDAAIQLYRRDALQYMLLVALAYAPWVVLQLVVLGGLDPAEAVVGGTFSAAAILMGIGTFVTFSVMSAVLVRLSAGQYLGERRELGDVVREVLPRVPTVMATALGRYVLGIVGLLALIVGVLYVLARWFAVTPAVVLEREGFRGAFARSSALSDGHKRHILNTLLLGWLLYFVGSIAVALVAEMGGRMLSIAASSIYTVVAYPIIGILEMLLYYDMRVRKEGYDLQVMADALEPAPAPAR